MIKNYINIVEWKQLEIKFKNEIISNYVNFVYQLLIAVPDILISYKNTAILD